MSHNTNANVEFGCDRYTQDVKIGTNTKRICALRINVLIAVKRTCSLVTNQQMVAKKVGNTTMPSSFQFIDITTTANFVKEFG